MKLDPRPLKLIELEHEARLRVLYELRGWIEPEIRMLEQILDRPLSGRE
jgi:hypothetical protein